MEIIIQLIETCLAVGIMIYGINNMYQDVKRRKIFCEHSGYHYISTLLFIASLSIYIFTKFYYMKFVEPFNIENIFWLMLDLIYLGGIFITLKHFKDEDTNKFNYCEVK